MLQSRHFRDNHSTLGMAHNLALNPVLATTLKPLIGYRKATEIAKAAVRKNRPILELALEMTDIDEDNLRTLSDPENRVQNNPLKPE